MQQDTTVPSVGQGYIKFIYAIEISSHQVHYKDSRWICLKKCANIVPKTSEFRLKHWYL